MKNPFHKSIGFKMGAAILALEGCVFAVLGAYYAHHMRAHIDRDILDRVRLPGQILSDGTMGLNTVMNREWIERLIGTEWIELADGLIVNPQGTIQHSLDSNRIGQNAFRLGNLDPQWFGGRSAGNGIHIRPSEKGSIVICIQPITRRPPADGALYSCIVIKTDRAQRIKASISWFFAIGSFLGVCLTFLTIFAAFRFLFSKRIGSLTAVLQRVEQGDLNARIEGIKPRDEIGTILKRVNAIVMKLQETIQVLEKRLFDLKESEKEREHIRIQFYQAQKMEALGVLTGGVAHDFNNLLTAIQGCTDMALLHTPETEPSHQDLMEIQMAAQRASDLTRQLLLFGRKQPMKYMPINLNKLIEDLQKILHRLIGEDIGISTPVELDLWTVHADKSCMEQMIINLAVNAKDSMPHGGMLTIRTENVELDERGCSRITGSRIGRFVRLIVADTGVGIEPEVLEHIFEPFFSTKEPGKGTGLGLSVVYGIIEQHGGFIQVASQVNQGSSLEIYLPAVPEKVEATIEEVHPDLDAFRGNGEKILVVEDEKSVREFLSSALQRNGYEVHIAANVADALDLFELKKGDFQMVFSDVVLPDRNGVDLVEELLERKPDLAVLLSSGYTDQKSKWQLIQKKNYRFLNKPYRLNFLLRTIREVLVQRKD